MTEPSANTPGSNADSGTPAKSSAIKDRACPYCNTYFTSSSLGRHLDLYIKEKNPKPPDGIHNIEQIRRSRGNITRRQARTASAKREGSSPASSKPTPVQDQRSPSLSRQPYTNGESAPVVHGINRANWTATGVINDLPPTPSQNGTMRYDIRRGQPRRIPNKVAIVQRQKMVEERDQGRAAQLALREVLDNLKAATYRAHPPHVYDFNWFEQSFPSLCLRCLNTPSTIFSSVPLSTPTSWPIGIPGPAHFDALKQQLEFKLRWYRKHSKEEPGLNRTTSMISSNGTETQPDRDKPYIDHLANAFHSWNALPETQKQEFWHLESLRAFAREQKEHGETHVKMERMEQEIANLHAQLDRLNKCQQPSEFATWGSSTVPISRATSDALAEAMPEKQWDYDYWVNRWKARIQSDRNQQQSLTSPLSSKPTPHDLNGGSINRQLTNGDDYHGQQHPDDISDSDLIDAPGEEDEEIAGSSRDFGGVLDPKLRDQGDEIMQGIEGRYEDASAR